MTGKSSGCCLEVVLSWSVQVTPQLSRRTLSTHTDKDIPWKHELLTLHEWLNFVVSCMFTVYFVYASLSSLLLYCWTHLRHPRKVKHQPAAIALTSCTPKETIILLQKGIKSTCPSTGKLVRKDLGCKHLDSKLILRKMPLSEAALSTCLTHVVGTVIIVQDLCH